LISLKAPAKINLYLDILDKRQDGYHNIITVFQTISMFDIINGERVKRGIEVEVKGKWDVLKGKGNLMHRAAKEFFNYTGINGGIHLVVRKNIPPARGLGGGSSDAAITIIMLNYLFSTGLSTEEMVRIGGKVGSDVPFFFYGGTVLAMGRGNKFIETILPTPNYRVLVFIPAFGIPTREAYKKFFLTNKEYSVKLSAKELVEIYKKGENLVFENAFQPFALKEFPLLARVREILLSERSSGVLLSGSGSSIFALFKNRGDAEAAGEKVRRFGNLWYGELLSRDIYQQLLKI